MAGERLGGTNGATIGAIGSIVAVCAIAIFGYTSTIAAKRDHDDVARRFDALNARLDEAGKEIAAVKKTAATPDATHKDFRAIEASIKAIGNTLADMKKVPAASDVAAQTNAQVGAQVNAQVAPLDAKLTDIGGKADAGKALAQQNSAAIAKLETSVGALHDSVAAQNKSLDTISGSLAGITQSLDTIKTDMKTGAATTASTVAAKPAVSGATPAGGAASTDTAAQPENNLVVVYLPAQLSPNMTEPGAPAPLSVRFDKIGSTHPATDAATLVDDLKKIIKDRKGCIVSVAGFADTLGTDRVNLAVSQERAEAIAGQLRTAFAGQNVQVNKVAWGERQLKVWTPDGKSQKANRRVDISVDCKS